MPSSSPASSMSTLASFILASLSLGASSTCAAISPPPRQLQGLKGFSPATLISRFQDYCSSGAPLALDCSVEVDCRDGEAYCGRCCRRAAVPLLRSDIERLAGELGDVHRYVEWVSGVPVLKRIKGGACVLLDPSSGRCTVYEARPLACRLYPLIYTPGLWVHVDPACPKSSTVSVETIVKCASLVEDFPKMVARDWLREVHVLSASSYREALRKSLVAKFNMR
uniref:YkgJ family cysteine cluster protein n=1 Tax=Thermofilum pendens TaxID=2269 RepID=A0A7J3X6S1_THEPE